ncbi:hypothetical protein Pcac1_g13364 [Phytophthora cactorum]|nr:hypothetical protein Pcac1_g16757 [Phytophthora cactorum]KAG2776080.1 hypothetical protein Pcac1_g13364 [Phytophthora cactorum]KAG3016880.1 hypothetical protein PC120_g11348 [Phytophthora cactorum]
MWLALTTTKNRSWSTLRDRRWETTVDHVCGQLEPTGRIGVGRDSRLNGFDFTKALSLDHAQESMFNHFVSREPLLLGRENPCSTTSSMP